MTFDDIIDKGLRLFIENNYTNAIVEFERVSLSDSNSDKVLAFSYIGSCYLENGSYEKAKEALAEGIKLNSKSFELNYKLGIAYFKLKSFEEADKVFRQALICSSNSEEREKLVLWQSKAIIELDEIKLNIMKKVGNIKFSHNWHQDHEKLVVSLDSNVQLGKLNCSVKFEPKAFNVYVDDIPVYGIPLSNIIDEKTSSYKVLTQKIEIILMKDIKSFPWITLDSKSASNVQSYPSSCQNKVDFTTLDKKLKQELKKEEKHEGNDAMMYLFKEIYANANEDTRRAMMKSYATSGGTVLSTNWSEVKEKQYEGKDRPTAPEGQMWADEKK